MQAGEASGFRLIAGTRETGKLQKVYGLEAVGN
jgi:hypothetical protein